MEAFFCGGRTYSETLFVGPLIFAPFCGGSEDISARTISLRVIGGSILSGTGAR